jgi:Rrf2 family protein
MTPALHEIKTEAALAGRVDMPAFFTKMVMLPGSELMRVSAKAEYACVALVELANRSAQTGPVSLKAIAEQYGISPAFLTQIFMQLKGAGIVMSIRGPAGGYQLAKDPDEISLAEVIETIDGPVRPSSGLAGLEQHPIIDTLQGVWQRVAAAQHDILQGITLADLVRQAHDAGVAFYQI